jgi:hypothetical protein
MPDPCQRFRDSVEARLDTLVAGKGPLHRLLNWQAWKIAKALGI